MPYPVKFGFDQCKIDRVLFNSIILMNASHFGVTHCTIGNFIISAQVLRTKARLHTCTRMGNDSNK